MIPAYDMDMMRSHPQTSDLYLVIQQPQRFSEGLYMGDREWLDWDWSCQINGAPAGDPVVQLTVNGGSGNAALLSGMTVLIGSTLGEWDKAIVRLRGDQNVVAGTVTLDIATSSDIAGIVDDGDWVVVLDEFRLWQIYGRIVADPVAETIDWYKDWDILWDDIAGTDANRRISMIPPVPIMGPHAVKFVDPPDEEAQFWFDWGDSYDPSTNPADPAITAYTSWGETDHVGGTWNSAVEHPGWQTVDHISGLRGFRTILEVNNAFGNAATLPYRRGVRYVFTLRRPGQSQAHDPPNSEPIINFRLDAHPAASFEQGYWRTSITVFEEDASKYNIMPGALVILFTEDWYMLNSPYLDPRGMRDESVGRVFDRENILMSGRIDGASISINAETHDVSFDIISIGEETASYRNYPIVINDNLLTEDWIGTPTLTVDRATRYYTAWHTTLSLVTDVYQVGDDHTIKAQDFLEGDIYSTLNTFLWDRLFARMLVDKYGRVINEIDVQMQPYGSAETLFTLEDTDWLDNLQIKSLEMDRCKAAECGGIIYNVGDIIPRLSRAPGSYDGYRGVTEPSNALAITDQDELNILSGRYYQYKNHKWEMGVELAGNWRWMDIVPQSAVLVADMDVERGTIDGRMIIREVSNTFKLDNGCIFTSIAVESEENDGKAGVTVDIPEDLPDPPPVTRPRIPTPPGRPPTPLDPISDSGVRIISTDVGVFVTDDIGAAYPYWYGVNNGFVTADDLRVMDIKRDPFHWWTSGGTERTLWALCGSGVWKHENFPNGTWVQWIPYADFITAGMIDRAPRNALWYGRMNMSIEVENLYAVTMWNDRFGTSECWGFVLADAIISNATQFYGTNDGGGWGDVKFAPHSAGNVIYIAANRAPAHGASSEATLHATPNRGGAWGIVDTLDVNRKGDWASISIPYVDAANPDLYILWGRGGVGAGQAGRYRISGDGSGTFTTIPDSETNQSKIGTGGHPDYIAFLGADIDNDEAKWSNDRGLTYTLLPLAPISEIAMAGFTVWGDGVLQSMLIGTYVAEPFTGTTYMYGWVQGLAAWADKTGNLNGFGVGKVYQIDRDSMGTA